MKLALKFIWVEYIEPFLEVLATLLLSPIWVPLALIFQYCAHVADKWHEFKKTEAAAAARASDGVGGDTK